MSKIAQIIDKMSEEEQKVVLHLREVHDCLMELDRRKTQALQQKAVFLNYISGEGRKLDTMPHYYEVPDGKGGYNVKETYYTFIK